MGQCVVPKASRRDVMQLLALETCRGSQGMFEGRAFSAGSECCLSWSITSSLTAAPAASGNKGDSPASGEVRGRRGNREQIHLCWGWQ